jgi:hypothetical protein
MLAHVLAHLLDRVPAAVSAGGASSNGHRAAGPDALAVLRPWPAEARRRPMAVGCAVLVPRADVDAYCANEPVTVMTVGCAGEDRAAFWKAERPPDGEAVSP